MDETGHEKHQKQTATEEPVCAERSHCVVSSVFISEMMGLRWEKIRHIKMADESGFIPKKEDTKIVGDIGPLQKNFVLHRNFWNYPALLAFHSQRLTHLFYLSKYSKVLHDIMYTFRKKPIQDDNGIRGV